MKKIKFDIGVIGMLDGLVTGGHLIRVDNDYHYKNQLEVKAASITDTSIFLDERLYAGITNTEINHTFFTFKNPYIQFLFHVLVCVLLVGGGPILGVLVTSLMGSPASLSYMLSNDIPITLVNFIENDFVILTGGIGLIVGLFFGIVSTVSYIEDC